MSSAIQRKATSSLVPLYGGIVEAVWIAAVSVVPLLLDPEVANLSPEVPKFAFLRILAIVGLAAWVVEIAQKFGEGSCSWTDFPRWLRAPLIGPLSLLGVAMGVSALFSINQEKSFWGAPESFQGILTWSAGFVLTAMIATHLRRREQVERLVTVLLITSLGVSVFACVQRAGFDPRHLDSKGDRIFSTLGHATFLSGYLIMVMPLTLWRIFNLTPGSGGSSGSMGLRIAGVILYGLVLVAQIFAFLFTESRGALLGLVAGLFCFVVLIGAVTARRWLLVLSSGFLAVAILFLVLLNVPHTPLKQWTSLPVLRRFSQVFSRGEAAASIRQQYWADAVNIMKSEVPLPFPSGGQDAYHRIRPWVGYGVNTVLCVVPHYHVKSNDEIIPGLHNLFWDQLYSDGVLGLLALQILLAVVFFHGFRTLGLIRSRRAALAFLLTVVASTIGGALALSTILEPAFAGMGWVFGFISGIVAFALCQSLLSNLPARGSDEFGGLALLAALLSALVAHLIDLSFVFWTAGTATFFFVYIGVLMAIFAGVGDGTARDLRILNDQSAPAPNPNWPWSNATITQGTVLCSSLITAIALVTLLYDFIHGYFRQPFTIGQMLTTSMYRMNGLPSLLILPVAIFWTASSLALALDDALIGKVKNFIQNFLLALAFSGGLGLAYAFWKGAQIVAIGTVPDAKSTGWEVLAQAGRYEQLHFMAVIALMALTVFLGWTLVPRLDKSAKSAPAALWAGIAVLAVAPILIWTVGIKPLQGPLQGQWGVLVNNFLGLPTQANEVFKHVLTVAPKDFPDRERLALLLLSEARPTSDVEAAKSLYAEAELVLKTEPERTGLNQRSFLLGETYLSWGLAETNTSRAALGQKAARSFAEAQIFEPGNEEVWTAGAMVDLLLLHDETASAIKKGRALKLAKLYPDYWAHHYAKKSAMPGNGALQDKYAGVACDYYGALLQTTNLPAQAAAQFQFERAKLLMTLGNLAEATTNLEAAVRSCSADSLWSIEASLAEAYQKQSNLPAAREHLRRAISSAPVAERSGLMRRFLSN